MLCSIQILGETFKRKSSGKRSKLALLQQQESSDISYVVTSLLVSLADICVYIGQTGEQICYDVIIFMVSNLRNAYIACS